MKAHIGLCGSAKPDKPIQQSGAQYLALVTLLLWLLPKNIVSWNMNKELSVLVHLFVFFFLIEEYLKTVLEIGGILWL